ncbi:MAG: AAA family ATPase, partial [Phycisphaerales bacterium]
MVRVAHKYMPDEMPEDEFKATFTARRHTLDYLIEAVRQQISKQTLTSYLITAPRGAGKTALIRMLYLELCADQELTQAWLCIRFPEELPNVTSLRDVLAAALEILAEQGIAKARDWHQKVEADMDEQHSQELAITGLRQIAQDQGRRLILLIENLDKLFVRGLTESTKATLRRLLMTDPFMMIVGSTVQIFPAVRTYDEAFFNYFCPVPLERLNEEQACDLLRKRAAWDHNAEFEAQYQKHRSKIRAISLLTGGNPRLLLMLYEILALQQMDSVVIALRTLVDELTPLLKDILEHQLAGQQVRILDALMQLNGKAQPTELAKKSRLGLNTVTSQLKRLVEADVLEVEGGGKGRPAWYTVTDRLFYTWYQMRYLRPQKRRIELFVQVLQHWFEAERRLEHLRAISSQLADSPALRARSLARTAEYFAASLSQTPLADKAHTLAIQNWIQAGDISEALTVYDEWHRVASDSNVKASRASFVELSRWLSQQGDPKHGMEILKKRLDDNPNDLECLMEYGVAAGLNGEHDLARSCFSRIVASSGADSELKALALVNCGVSKRMQEDFDGAIADYTAAVELDNAPVDQVAQA